MLNKNPGIMLSLLRMRLIHALEDSRKKKEKVAVNELISGGRDFFCLSRMPF